MQKLVEGFGTRASWLFTTFYMGVCALNRLCGVEASRFVSGDLCLRVPSEVLLMFGVEALGLYYKL